ncbi:tetratricopeptide repeat protein [Psychrobium sp. 1_MG-2023]|uniref:tetratricopeptide repeat protein n=1 Tax=Psychrobium sp. 1_MG-2023 TaxID=3062624 RepID=UPI000C33B8FA|nr:tetratricopeptide repeat protein [Psychrobium sp. 1_MG-2023]MDP2560087.1 tetratricopeptide repeat protein [Psychrobium sp. 1_MG-2023]PKF56254.1 hypothetical protein CW748_09820 [Alteromonadales bacterium alter-6D02]
MIKCHSSIIFLALLLCGCAQHSQQLKEPNRQLFLDNAFTKPVGIQPASKVFSLSGEQKLWIRSQVQYGAKKTLTTQLIDNVLMKDYRAFDYDNSYTRTASETLSMKQGNCLSMVIMTASIAKFLGIPYQLQEIASAPLWDRNGGLYLVNGHVNIRLKEQRINQTNISYNLINREYVTVDFLPSATRRHLSREVIKEHKLIAMYYVNLAADAMVAKDWRRAYWLIRQSIDSDPSFSPAWNSLAVIYRYNNQLALAEKVYRYAMVLAPENMNVVANYALLLESQGRFIELIPYQKRVDLAKLKNPYRYFDRAENAYERQQYREAISLYKKAIKLSSDVDRFYFGLFKSYYALGQISKAKYQLKQAQQRSLTYENRQRYNAKLALLTKR